MERGREGNTADLSQPELEKKTRNTENWESNTVDHKQSRKREHTTDKKSKTEKIFQSV